MGEQLFSEHAGQGRDVHLDQVGQVGGDDAAQRLGDPRMIAAEPEHAPAAQEVEVAGAGRIEEIGSLAGDQAEVVADGAQHADHGFVGGRADEKKRSVCRAAKTAAMSPPASAEPEDADKAAAWLISASRGAPSLVR